jgi:flagellar biosynthesis GTPase FlhF
MRTNLFTLLFCVLLACAAQAQSNPVYETDRTMSFGTRPCFRMEFANTDAGMVEDIWKDFAKKTYNAKLKKDKKSGEFAATGLKAAGMGSDPFSIYSTVEKTGNGAALTIWYDAGSYFLNRRDNASRTEEASRTLKSLYFDVRRAAIQKEIAAEENRLKEMENKQKKLAKENDKLHKDIEDYKAKIKKAEDDIVTNDRAQEANTADMENQRKNIENIRQRLSNVENERN